MPKKARTKTVPRSLARVFAKEAREVLIGSNDALDLGNIRLAAIGAVNACIRATDALCVQALGFHAAGDDHGEATEMLEMVPEGKVLVKKLRVALQYKSQWSYGVTNISQSDLKKVLRAAEALIEEAERRA